VSELDHLLYDLQFIPAAVADNRAMFDALGDTRDPQRHTFHAVSLDLSWQCLGHAAGAAALLSQGLVPPLFPVQRALFESLASLRYLASHVDRDREATIFQAYTYIRDRVDFSDDQALITERDTILSAMPEDIRATAEHRSSNHPWTWSGLRIQEVAERAGLTGFHRLWGHLSARSHAGRAGRGVRFGEVNGNKQGVTIGEVLSELDAEAHANFSRRALHAAFRCLWGHFESPHIVLPTPDPASFTSK
jgi:hypothetical protein